MDAQKQRLLLIGGLGHTDLSGKVPRLGLLMLREALRRAGHDAVIENYAMSLNDRLFPPRISSQLARLYERSIHPFVVDGTNPWTHPVKAVRFGLDMKRLRGLGRQLAQFEKDAFEHVATAVTRRIEQEDYDAVGFSLYVGGSTVAALLIADRLRDTFPDLPVFFGGPQTTHFAETIFRTTHAPTALVLGEGEKAIVGLAERLDAVRSGSTDCMRDVPNLCYRDGSGDIVYTRRERMTEEEWVELSGGVYEEADFDGLLQHAFIETSRGCSNMCRFCAQPLVSGTHRYLKPAARVVDEMVQLNRELGISRFECVGSSTPPSQAGAIADELRSRNLQDAFRWILFMRGRDGKTDAAALPGFMEKIGAAGCSSVFFGVEAADNETLRKMGKHETVEDIEAAMTASRQAGIATVGSFIYPYPGMPENEEDLILAFIDRVRPLSAPVQPLGLYPGTWCAQHANEIGCEIMYPSRHDQKAFLAGQKEQPTMDSPEVLTYFLTYPLILSLPMRFWDPFPYKIDGMDYVQYQKMAGKLQKRIAKRNVLLGFSHSHYLMSETLNMTPQDFSERLLYFSITGDGQVARDLIERCNT